MSKGSAINPSHYSPASGGVDVIAFCDSNDIPFIEGNVIKYVVRWKQKNGLEDLRKAREYLERLISIETSRMPF